MVLYTIDSKNKHENSGQIPADTTELNIAYEGFKSCAGIGRAPALQKVTISDCKQKISLDGAEQCLNL